MLALTGLLLISVAQTEPISVGTDKQLFIGPWTEHGRDEYLVESMTNVTMKMNEAKITGEQHEWVNKSVTQRPPPSGVMIEDGDTVRLYYMGGLNPKFQYPNDNPKEPYCSILRYAESKDGIHWEKPDLGLFEWEGTRDNNILFPNDDFPYMFSSVGPNTVFIDPNTKNPDERYKMTMKITPLEGGDSKKTPTLTKGKYGFVSPDGIHWKLATGRLGTSGDGIFAPFWDDRIGKYVAYSRVKTFNDPRQVRYYREHYGDRELAWRARLLRIGRSISDDFVNWSEETIVIAPDELDETKKTQALPTSFCPAPNRVDFYSASVFKCTPHIYIALLHVYSHWRAVMRENGTLDQYPGTIDVQLATSRDGIHWNRSPLRKPFIRLGPEGSFYSGMIFAQGPPLHIDDNLYFSVSCWDKAHWEKTVKPPVTSRAALRLDGFISADSAYTGGELTTKPLVFEGRELQLNLTTGAGGTVQVEIQNGANNPIEGFAVGDADEINGNYTGILASWNGKADVSSLVGQVVKLRFLMRDSKLYSFQFLP